MSDLGGLAFERQDELTPAAAAPAAPRGDVSQRDAALGEASRARPAKRRGAIDLETLDRRARIIGAKSRANKKLTVTVTLDEYKEIIDLCENANMPVATMMRRLIGLGLRHYKNFGPVDDGPFGLPSESGARPLEVFEDVRRNAQEAGFGAAFREAVMREEGSGEVAALRSLLPATHTDLGGPRVPIDYGPQPRRVEPA